MKMLSSALTLMIVYMSASAVNGNSLRDMIGLYFPGSKPCKTPCIPEKWEGNDGGFIGSNVNGTGHGQGWNYKISYDASIKKVEVSGMVSIDGKAYTIKALQDYTKKIMYVVADEKCTEHKLTDWPGRCVPCSAHKIPATYFGAGNNTLDIQTYYWQAKGQSISITFTKDGVPVSEILTGGTQTSGYMSVSGYTGLKLGIKDPSVFNVPAACHKVEFHEVAKHVVEHLKKTSFLFL